VSENYPYSEKLGVRKRSL